MNYDIYEAMNQLNDLFTKFVLVHDVRSEIQQMNLSPENIKSLDDKIQEIQTSTYNLQKQIIEAFESMHMTPPENMFVPNFNLN
jgi:hypothetical protein